MSANFAKMFGGDAIQAIINTPPLTRSFFSDLFPMTAREKAIREMFPKMDAGMVCVYIDKFQQSYNGLTEKNSTLHNTTLDLSQELATQNAEHSKLFNVVKTTAQGIKDKVSSKQVGFIFKRTVAPEKMTVEEVNQYVDDVQRSIGELKTSKNPFLFSSLHKCERIAKEIKDGLEYCKAAAKYMHETDPAPEWTSRFQRANEIETLVNISIVNLKRLGKEIDLNVTRMETFTSIAINVMLMQLQQFVLSQSDPTELLASIDELLTKG